MNEDIFQCWKSQIDWFNSCHFKVALDKIACDRRSRIAVYPACEDMFNAFKWFKLEDTKVVILGQDPYPDPGHADGLAFSVRPGVKLPRSLSIIFKEIERDLGKDKVPKNGNLKGWAQQGVLLLNTALSVRCGKPGSHSNIWEGLVCEVICKVSEETDHCVFIFWGDKAMEHKKCLKNPDGDHKIIKSAHPAARGNPKKPFVGSKPFSRTNEHLEKKACRIDWSASCVSEQIT